jgi:hypothetical protein
MPVIICILTSNRTSMHNIKPVIELWLLVNQRILSMHIFKCLCLDVFFNHCNQSNASMLVSVNNGFYPNECVQNCSWAKPKQYGVFSTSECLWLNFFLHIQMPVCVMRWLISRSHDFVLCKYHVISVIVSPYFCFLPGLFPALRRLLRLLPTLPDFMLFLTFPGLLTWFPTVEPGRFGLGHVTSFRPGDFRREASCQLTSFRCWPFGGFRRNVVYVIHSFSSMGMTTIPVTPNKLNGI